MSSFADQLDRFFYRPDEEDAPLPPLPQAELPPAPAEETAPLELLAFRLEDETYGVPLEEVREIVRVPRLTEVPRAPANVIGVMNVRGEVLAVYDLKVRLQLAPRLPKVAGPDAELGALPRSARVIVLRGGPPGDAGILVDSVVDVLRTRAAELEPPPAGVPERGLVAGLGRWKGGLCILLDPEQALS